MRRRGAGLVLVALALGLGPAAAQAATVSPADGGTRLLFFAEPGEQNQLTVSLAGGQYTFTDPGADVTALLSPPCSAVPGDPHSVTCVAAGVVEVEAQLGDGNDTATFDASTRSRLLGGDGNDVLTGGEGNDDLLGGTGDDTLHGRGGDDELDGEEPPFMTLGANVLDGGPGQDRLNGGGGPDTLQGGEGADSLFGFGGADDLEGGDGADFLSGGLGNDVMRGGGGNDTLGDEGEQVFGLPPEAGNDLIEGGPGDDLLRPGNGPVSGTTDDDTLRGGSGRDTVDYHTRATELTVSLDGVANDGAAGEADNVAADVERLVGGSAGDLLTGGPGPDEIDGFRGADVIDGGPGDDTLDGGVEDAEGDEVSGGEGDDRVRGDAGDDKLAGNGGRDVVEGGGGDDEVSGGGGNDTLSGGPGRDTISGGDGADVLRGAAPGPVGLDGGDTLRGEGGDDTLEGDDGDDVLTGGAGADRLGGGLGRDTADYADARSPVTVSLDGRPNDGQRGERDNVLSDVEDIAGGRVQDTFSGSGGANKLDGGAGEDFVDGRGGRDDLHGGSARDVVRARDGVPDVVDCGRGVDFAILDRRDRTRHCERRDRGHGRAERGRDVVVRPRARGPQFGLPGSSRSVPLLDRIAVPVATALDVHKGSVLLAAQRIRRSPQVGTFLGTKFRVLQSRARAAAVELRLIGGDFAKCRARHAGGGPRAAAARRRLSRRTIRRLRARTRGRFRTTGRYSAATVRGTDYTVEDRCDGTLTRVRRGVVAVRDFRRRRTIRLRAGQSYLARAPG